MQKLESWARFVVLMAFLAMGATAALAEPVSAPPGALPPASKETAPGDNSKPRDAEEAEFTVSGVAADGSSIVLRTKTNALLTLAVGAGDKGAVARYRPSDQVVATTLDGRLLSVRPRTERVEVRALWTGIAVALFFLGATYVLLRWAGRSVLDLLRGKDGRYSNSQFQATAWFSVLVFVYVTSFVVRWLASGGALTRGPEIPQNLVLLSGLSAISFVGARAITESKIQRTMDKIQASQTGRPPGPPAKAEVVPPLARHAALRRAAERVVKPGAPSKFPLDLLCDDQGRPDFGDTQMLLITIMAVGTYLAQAVVWLESMEQVSMTTLPDVSSTILATFGLGQGAYLVKKGVGSGGE